MFVFHGIRCSREALRLAAPGAITHRFVMLVNFGLSISMAHRSPAVGFVGMPSIVVFGGSLVSVPESGGVAEAEVPKQEGASAKTKEQIISR